MATIVRTCLVCGRSYTLDAGRAATAIDCKCGAALPRAAAVAGPAVLPVAAAPTAVAQVVYHYVSWWRAMPRLAGLIVAAAVGVVLLAFLFSGPDNFSAAVWNNWPYVRMVLTLSVFAGPFFLPIVLSLYRILSMGRWIALSVFFFILTTIGFFMVMALNVSAANQRWVDPQGYAWLQAVSVCVSFAVVTCLSAGLGSLLAAAVHPKPKV